MHKEELFATPLYRFDLDDAELLNVYLKSRLYSWRDQHSKGDGRTTAHHAGTWESSETMHEMQAYRLFLNTVTEAVGSLDDGLWCHAMKANISDRFGHGPITGSHSGLWSGLYCVQTPDNCGNILFHDPRTAMRQRSVDPVNNGELQDDQVVKRYTAKAGLLLVYPCWLEVAMEKNRTTLRGLDGDRITVHCLFSETTPAT